MNELETVREHFKVGSISGSVDFDALPHILSSIILEERQEKEPKKPKQKWWVALIVGARHKERSYTHRFRSTGGSMMRVSHHVNPAYLEMDCFEQLIQASSRAHAQEAANTLAKVKYPDEEGWLRTICVHRVKGGERKRLTDSERKGSLIGQ